MFRQNFISAYRHLVKNKIFSALNILGLSISLALIICISSWVKSELSFDHFADGDRIFRLLGEWDLGDNVWQLSTMPYPLADILQEQSADVEETTRFLKHAAIRPTIRYKDHLFYEDDFAYVDDNWFDFFSADNQAPQFQSRNSVVLTEDRAQRIFGSSNPIGETIEIDGTPFSISHVVPDPPDNSSFQFHTMVPINSRLADSANLANDSDWGNWNYSTFVKLRSADRGTDVSQTATEIMALHQDANKSDVRLEPISAMHFNADAPVYGGAAIGSRRSISILSLIGFLICLSAGFNYINLTLANASEREKEVGIRKLMGGNRRGLVGKFVAEGALIVFAAFALAIVLGQLLSPVLATIGLAVPNLLQYVSDWILLGVMACAILLLISLYPAALLSRIRPIRLVAHHQSRQEGFGFRRALIVTQFTISTVLIICAIVVASQHRYMLNIDLGYDVSHVIEVPISRDVLPFDSRASILSQLEDEIGQIAGVENCAYASAPIINMRSWTQGSLSWPGKPEAYQPKTYQLSVSEMYDQTMDLTMKSGKWFDLEHKTDAENIVINETAARLIDFPDLEGQEVTFQGQTGKIIGVVEDFHFQSMHSRIEPLVIFHNPAWCNSMYVRTHASQTATVLQELESVFASRFPGKPFEYDFMDESHQAMYATERQHVGLANIFSGFAILVSCLGLAGLAILSAQRRRREIGIRKVLGASLVGVLKLLTRQYLTMVFLGVAIATVVSFILMKKWLDQFAYVDPLSVRPFIVGSFLMAAIALLCVALLSARAALTNPVEVLKE